MLSLERGLHHNCMVCHRPTNLNNDNNNLTLIRENIHMYVAVHLKEHPVKTTCFN